MTSNKKKKSSPEKFYHGLVLEYEDFDFILDRDYVFASITLEKTFPLGVEWQYLNQGIEYKDSVIPMIDFAPYLQSVFQYIDESKSNVVLIIEVKSLGIAHRQKLAALFSHVTHEKFNGQYIGLRAGNRANVEKIKFKDLRLTPICLQKSQWHAGLLGMRFLKDKKRKTTRKEQLRIQYLLDLERVVFNLIVPLIEKKHGLVKNP